MEGRFEILGATRERLIAEARSVLPVGHGVAAAIHRNAHREGTFEPERHGLGTRAAEAWRRHFALSLPAALRTLVEPGSAAGAHPTTKVALRTLDGLEIETVRIGIGDRRQSQCVSSQAGCAMGCSFCETGRMGLLRDLRPEEIVGQVVVGRRQLGWRPDTIVFQGMGEPLDAADAVIAAVLALGDPHGLGLAAERITICTAGHVDGLRRLAAAGLGRLNLSLSLNAADDAQRAALMPITRRWPLAEVQRALVDLRPRRNWQLGLHWCLLPGINDSRDDARRIARFAAPLGRVMLHLIPYNPGSVPLTRPPDEAEIVRFVGWLRDEGLPVRRRITKGRAVMAGCGQLGNPSLRRRNPRVAAAAPGARA
jgi:23S rRNA (adenine2503-C2)-methyltransferase